MGSNNLSFTSQQRFATFYACCYSILLWISVVFLCFSALMLLQLACSTHAREALLHFLSDYPILVGLSALLPLTGAGALMTYLIRYRHARYTFHSALLAYDVDPKIIASTIETGWNRKHPHVPISCHVTSTGNSLKVSITAPPPSETAERQRAEELHAWAMDQLQALLITKHPITFHIQWNALPSLQSPLHATLPNT